MPLPPESPFTRALKRFQDGLTPKEIDDFKATTIADVWDKAKELQREQNMRGSMQNMARITPFIHGLTKYSGVIEVFVQAKPDIMAFIWGPLKFLLQIASKFADHFEKLLDAFQSIGENLPRFQIYEKIFQYDPHDRLQEVIALVYEDIMEFLRRTWKFFRRRAWHIFFDSVWNDFDGRFKSILDKLSRHKELLDKQAIVSEMQEAGTARKAYHEKMDNINDILVAEIRKAKEARKLAEAEVKKAEHERILRQRRAVIDWIHGIAVEDDQERHSAHRHPGTGKWLFLRKEFNEWCNGVSRTLWLTGKPGCGKTILASTIIEELQSARKQQVLYFFCDYRDMTKNTLHVILRALTTQFLHQNPDILPVASQWPEHSGLPRASLKALKKYFKELVQSSIEPIYLILDGMDECDDNSNNNQQQLIQNYLYDLITNTDHGPPKYIRVCIFSREIRLEGKFKKLIGNKVRIDKTSNGCDIQEYLVSELHQAKIQLEDERGIILPDMYLREIAGRLAEKADGMFLWTRLIIGSLLRVTTFEEFEENLCNLPDGLDQAYMLPTIKIHRTQRSPKDNEQQQILRILKWLACACRPVTLPEVESWLVVDPDSNKRRERPQIKDLDCSLLIEILPDTRVQFIHFSVKELSPPLLTYLNRLQELTGRGLRYILAGDGKNLHQSPFLRPVDAHLNAFKICVAYLSSDFLDLDADHKMDQHLLKGDYQLLSYCKIYWIHHFEDCLRLKPEKGIIDTTAATLARFLPNRINTASGLTLTQESLPASPVSVDRRHLWDSLVAVEDIDSQTLSILQAIRNHEGRLQKQYMKGLLIEEIHQWHVANDPLNLTRMFWRVQGHIEVHRGKPHTLYGPLFLCRHPACELQPGFLFQGFVSAVERQVHEDRHSRPFSCSHSSCDYARIGFASKRALSQHVKKRHPAAACDDSTVNIASLREIHPVSGNAQLRVPDVNTTVDNSALHQAVFEGKIETVQLLLDTGTDIHAVPLNGDTALHKAAQRGHALVATLLLRRGANIDARDITGGSALNDAAQFGHAAVVKLLLENGANTELLDRDGDTALINAAYNGNLEVVELLLEKGTRVDFRNKRGFTALHRAAQLGRVAVVELLLEKGADSELLVESRPAWSLALDNGHLKVAELLQKWHNSRTLI